MQIYEYNYLTQLLFKISKTDSFAIKHHLLMV